MQGPRLPQEAQGKNRQVHPLGDHAPTLLLGKSRPCICIPIGHAGTTFNDTATDIATALAQVRPSIAATRKQKGHKTPEISKTALLHGTRTAKTLLDKFWSLVQRGLLGIIAHRQQKIREQSAGSTNTTTIGGGTTNRAASI